MRRADKLQIWRRITRPSWAARRSVFARVLNDLAAFTVNGILVAVAPHCCTLVKSRDINGLAQETNMFDWLEFINTRFIIYVYFLYSCLQFKLFMYIYVLSIKKNFVLRLILYSCSHSQYTYTVQLLYLFNRLLLDVLFMFSPPHEMVN